MLNEHCANVKNEKRQHKIDELTQDLITIEESIAHSDKTESRLDALIAQDYRQLNTLTKSMMDSIKLLARNRFTIQFQPFKKAYNNYRDDHVLFRHLTQAHGFLRDPGTYVEVVLFPAACFQPKVIGIINVMSPKGPTVGERRFSVSISTLTTARTSFCWWHDLFRALVRQLRRCLVTVIEEA